MLRIKVKWIIYFFIMPISLILYSWVNASEGVFRRKKKVIFRSDIHKMLFGFPIWIEQIDRSYLFINIFNEIMAVLSVIGWFILDIEKKEYLLQKFPSIGIIIHLAELFWGIAIGILDARDGKDPVYIRETIDLQENQGNIIVGDANNYIYHYVYTHLRKEKVEKLVIILPESYFITEDVNGNFRILRKGRYEIVSNVGTYEELSDKLVREGFATLRCEREFKDLNNACEADASNLGKLFLEIMKKEKFSGRIYLLAHGRSNRLLIDMLSIIPISGIVSLCGAGVEFDEGYINSLISKNIPILFGYVQEDPYYSEASIEYIKKCVLEYIKIERFENTDFTFRECRVNKKKSIDKIGYKLVSGFQLPLMNPIVFDKILIWLNTH